MNKNTLIESYTAKYPQEMHNCACYEKLEQLTASVKASAFCSS